MIIAPKPLYTVVELARLLGLNRRACVPLLRRMGIPIQSGKPMYVWLSDIQSVAPEMYASWSESVRLRGQVDADAR